MPQATRKSHVPVGAIPTPLHARLEALSTARRWTNWAGFVSPLVLDTAEFEYFAIRNQSTLFDISPMHKYRITGPDALAVVNRLVTRDAGRMRDGRVGYALWCDEEGMVIDDGTLFRFSDTDFRLCCQEPMLGWLQETAWGFDADIRDESHEIAGLALQGPTSYSLLSDAGLAAVAEMSPKYRPEVDGPRLMGTLEMEMNHPDAAVHGIGDATDERIARSISLMVDSAGLPRSPAPEEIFTREFLPPLEERARPVG